MSNPYDEIPYTSHPFLQSHPDRLAAVAALLGLHAPPVERARVLELGCASGGNLLPMAATLPDASFLGVELSQRQVAAGQLVIAELGLKNVELRHADIRDLGPDLGTFDYVICHGVFSWVPGPVRERILDICGRHLAPGGVAYVSYNTYPGWHMRGMVRDMMLYHTADVRDAPTRITQARALLDFLAASVGKENTSYHHLLQGELDLLRRSSDNYLFHEQLEEANDPVYFHQFVARAEAHGLRYLGESDLSVMMPGQFPPEVRDVLHRLAADLTHLEQYMAFLRNRTFRQTLLVHASRTPNYQIEPSVLSGFLVSSSLQPDPRQPELFRSPLGPTVTATTPLFRAALEALADCWPRAVPFAVLCEQARARLDGVAIRDAAAAARDAEELGRWLLVLHTSAAGRLVDLHLRPPACTDAVADRPLAAPLARLQASRGSEVTNLRHERVELPDFDRHLLRHLDGTRDRAALREALAALAIAGALLVTRHGEPVRDRAALGNILDQAVGRQLPVLARNALLLDG